MNNADRNSDRNFWRLQIKELFCHLFFPKKNWQQNHWRISIAIFFNDSCQNTNKLEKSSCKVVRKKINSCEMVTHYTGLCFCAHWILIRLDCNNNSSSNQLNKPLIWPLLALWQIALDNCFPTRGWKSWKERTTNDENPPPAPTKSAAGRYTVGPNCQIPAKNYIKICEIDCLQQFDNFWIRRARRARNDRKWK